MVRSVKEALSTGRSVLKKNDVDEREARLLLALSMGVSVSELVKFDVCDEKQYSKYLNYIDIGCL